MDDRPICWACGQLMEWTGEYREIELEGGFMGIVDEPIYECVNPECWDDDDYDDRYDPMWAQRI